LAAHSKNFATKKTFRSILQSDLGSTNCGAWKMRPLIGISVRRQTPASALQTGHLGKHKVRPGVSMSRDLKPKTCFAGSPARFSINADPTIRAGNVRSWSRRESQGPGACGDPAANGAVFLVPLLEERATTTNRAACEDRFVIRTDNGKHSQAVRRFFTARARLGPGGLWALCRLTRPQRTAYTSAHEAQRFAFEGTYFPMVGQRRKRFSGGFDSRA